MFGKYVSIREQQLKKYRYSFGGGMTGGYYCKTIIRCGEQALISVESAKWHSQDPTVKEYLVDVALLDELETIIRKHRMNYWHGKKFTNMFVDDGESTSYHFSFDAADISFSSQIYPMKYQNKLAEFEDVIKKYIETGEKLPGLVNPKADDEEGHPFHKGELEIYVYSYVNNSLGIKIMNGTDEAVELSKAYRLINVDTGAVLLEDNIRYGGTFREHMTDEMDIRLKERLYAGNYKIIFGDLEIPFEIR